MGTNRTVVIGTTVEKPYGYPCQLQSECHLPGYGVETVHLTCEKLHWNCSLKVLNNMDYGQKLPNGLWTGVINKTLDHECDAFYPVLTPTYDRYQALDFSKTFFYDEVFLVTRMPPDSSSDGGNSIKLDVLRTFSCGVWVLVALSIVALTLAEHFLEYMRKTRNMGEISRNILLMSQVIFSFVLTSSFGGVIVSRKLTRIDNRPFVDMTSFVNCLQSRRCRFVTVTHTSSAYQYMTSDDHEHALSVRRAFEINPPELVSRHQLADLVLHTLDVFVTVMMPRPEYEHYTDGKADYFYAVKTSFVEQNCFTTTPISDLQAELDEMALFFREYGFNMAMKRKYNISAHQLVPKKPRVVSTADNSVTLRDSAFTFLILITGTIASFVAIIAERLFASETILHQKQRWYRKNICVAGSQHLPVI